LGLAVPDVLGLPVDLALQLLGETGLAVRVIPLVAPRSTVSVIGAPEAWRVARLKRWPEGLELVAVPADPALLPPDRHRMVQAS
jgi:hypothetical protein